jgi:hypothetical protein
LVVTPEEPENAVSANSRFLAPNVRSFVELASRLVDTVGE